MVSNCDTKRTQSAYDIAGLPVVPETQKAKLIKFLMRSLNRAGNLKEGEDSVHMPVRDGNSEG